VLCLVASRIYFAGTKLFINPKSFFARFPK